jgi:3'-5' exoribonuclease
MVNLELKGQQAKECLQCLEKRADGYGVRKLADIVLSEPRFMIWSGSSRPDQHHYGKHGLIEHVAEVIDLCEVNNAYFSVDGKGVDDQKLFLAALFHDVGKIWDYEPTNPDMTEWKDVDHKYKIHHISRSVIVWNQAVDITGMIINNVDEVTHAILSHHGLKEWGSPVQPETRLAWLLHLCDSMSARMDDVYKKVESRKKQ